MLHSYLVEVCDRCVSLSVVIRELTVWFLTGVGRVYGRQLSPIISCVLIHEITSLILAGEKKHASEIVSLGQNPEFEVECCLAEGQDVLCCLPLHV